jgi:SRSO17 transposase
MALPSDERTRFDLFVQRLAEAAGHADRRWPLEAYLTGLLCPAAHPVSLTSFPMRSQV